METEWINQAVVVWHTLVQGGWVACAMYLLIAWVVTHIVKRIFWRYMRARKYTHPAVRFLAKLSTSIIWVLALVQALRALGVDIVSIMGAAGVAGIAVGFASQTALSNLISGFFLISESSFKLGDYVRVADLEGTIESINLLSISIRQPDHSLIRIPCETLIKNPVINITNDQVRRCEFDVGVAYGSDLEKVREVVLQVVHDMPEMIESNEFTSAILFSSFGESSLNLHIGVWCKTRDYHTARFSFASALIRAFHNAHISIPFPTREIICGEPRNHAPSQSFFAASHPTQEN